MTRWKRGLVGGGIVLLAVLAVGGWNFYRLTQAFHMKNQVYSETRSPDGMSVATLAYRDGLTFGFYFVTLQPAAGWHPLQPDDPVPQTEVAEVAAEGLDAVTWHGPHTLVVTYEKSGEEHADFVLRKPRWRDVRIVYRGT